MADRQRAGITGNATMRVPITGNVNVGGSAIRELRFMPRSAFPEVGRSDVLYIDTLGECIYYWNGTEYIALSGGGSGGTSNYNELSNKPSINDITLTGNKTSADLGLQPTISDLATIRSGAASGATAVQPSDMETALASKQDVIDDLSDIRTGAAAGETAVQPSALETALSGKQDVISDIADIRSGAAAGATSLQPEDIDTLPTDGSSNPVSSGGTYNFVNSSIATNTAYFIGTFASVAELEAYTGTVTNNDYAFVTSTDSAGNTLYNRYKYNAATQVWSFEYAVNNTAFTAAQWAAIQSGLTSSDKTKLDGIEQGANKTVIDATPTSGSSNAVSSGGVHTALSGKQDTITDLSDIRSGASAGATAVQPSALNDYQTKLSETNKLDPAYIEYDATHRAVTDTEKSTWNGKQDAVSDLSTIRSGAAAGATAVQPTDMNTALAAKQDTLTFDTVPTQSSTNPVTSGGIWADQQRQDALEAEDRAALIKQVDEGAKNLLRNKASSQVVGGVTFTINDDGTIIANGTKTNNNWLYLSTGNSLAAGTYVLSSGLAPQSDVSLKLLIATADSLGSAIMSAEGARQVHIKQLTSDYTGLYYAIRISSGTTVNNIVFKPMLCTAADYAVSTKFVPYARTNAELTAKEQQNENNILLNTKYGGGRNVGNFAYYGLNNDQSIAAGTITYTESNGVFTFTGAADSSKNYACYLLKKQIIKAGKYVVSGISGGSTSTYWFRIGTGVSDTFKMNVTDSGTALTLDSDTKITLQLVVKSGVSLSNKVFSPMIITAADWANSHDFQQYGESNAQLSSIVQVDIDNMTEFKFAKLDELSSSVHFKYGFLIGGGGASSPNKVMLWHIFVNTSNSVYFTKIIGDDTMTLTGSISDGVLTITSSATIYGGLRLIWLG